MAAQRVRRRSLLASPSRLFAVDPCKPRRVSILLAYRLFSSEKRGAPSGAGGGW
jgi:hypothetical protein